MGRGPGTEDGGAGAATFGMEGLEAIVEVVVGEGEGFWWIVMQVTDWSMQWVLCAKKTGGLRLRRKDSWTSRRGRGLVVDLKTARGCAFFSGRESGATTGSGGADGRVRLVLARCGSLSGLTGKRKKGSLFLRW